MRILFICNYSALYGANRSLLTLVESFHQKKYTVMVLVPSHGPMSDELKAKGIPFKVIRYYSAFLYIKPILKHLAVPFLFGLNLINLPYLLYFTKNFKPDIIYSNTLAENLGIVIARMLGIKHILHAREFMSLDHGSYFILGSSLKRKYAKLSDGLIFVSNAVADFINSGSALSENQAVIFNGIASKDFDFENKDLSVSANFGIVGVLQESKGHYLCVDYFAKLLKIFPNCVLHIFGEGYGSYKNGLIQKIKEYGIEANVQFHGFVKNPDQIYGQMDILLMFSRSEGFGRVTAEAMLRAIPVVGLNNAGTSELIENEKTGYLFKNYQEFEHGTIKLLSDNVHFNQMRKQTLMTAKDLFSKEKYCSSVENFVLKTYSNQ
jgi:glycosyltransferase involved in cell wall biosynthesis